jgi:hypothetical protein
MRVQELATQIQPHMQLVVRVSIMGMANITAN